MNAHQQILGISKSLPIFYEVAQIANFFLRIRKRKEYWIQFIYEECKVARIKFNIKLDICYMYIV